MPRPENLGDLKAAGFNIKSPLPDEYQEVLEGLTEEEVALLVDIKRRFDEAERATPGHVAPFTTYFVPL